MTASIPLPQKKARDLTKPIKTILVLLIIVQFVILVMYFINATCDSFICRSYRSFACMGRYGSSKNHSMPLNDDRTSICDKSQAWRGKYFTEHDRFGHFDNRFFRGALDGRKLNETIEHLLINYIQFSASVNFTSWIAHGTLLGWYWNKKRLPWDDDIDFQTTFFQLSKATTYHNAVWKDRYLFDVNPNYVDRRLDINNVIDARFIDKETGIFVDITAVSKYGEILRCKRPHVYEYDELFPLHSTTLNNQKVWRPHNVKKILTQEYGSDALKLKNYKNFTFNETTKEWMLQ